MMQFETNALMASWFDDETVYRGTTFQNKLIVRLTNVSGNDIEFSTENSMLFHFPIGDEGVYPLTHKEIEKIVCTPPTNWLVTYASDTATWTANPQQTIEWEKGDSFLFVFENVTVNSNFQKDSMSCLNITYTFSAVPTPDIRLPFFISTPCSEIQKFVVDHNCAGIFDWLNFSWNIRGDSSCQVFLLPECNPQSDLSLALAGSQAVLIRETTDYSLFVRDGQDVKTQYSSVTVNDPEIVKFECNKENNMLKLSFVLKNTMHAYINCGVGRIDATPSYGNGFLQSQGEINVSPNAKIGRYILYCLGSSGMIKQELIVPTE